MAVEALEHHRFDREAGFQEAAAAGLQNMHRLIRILSNSQKQRIPEECSSMADATVSSFKKAVSLLGGRSGHARFRRAPGMAAASIDSIQNDQKQSTLSSSSGDDSEGSHGLLKRPHLSLTENDKNDKVEEAPKQYFTFLAGPSSPINRSNGSKAMSKTVEQASKQDQCSVYDGSRTGHSSIGHGLKAMDAIESNGSKSMQGSIGQAMGSIYTFENGSNSMPCVAGFSSSCLDSSIVPGSKAMDHSVAFGSKLMRNSFGHDAKAMDVSMSIQSSTGLGSKALDINDANAAKSMHTSIGHGTKSMDNSGSKSMNISFGHAPTPVNTNIGGLILANQMSKHEVAGFIPAMGPITHQKQSTYSLESNSVIPFWRIDGHRNRDQMPKTDLNQVANEVSKTNRMPKPNDHQIEPIQFVKPIQSNRGEHSPKTVLAISSSTLPTSQDYGSIQSQPPKLPPKSPNPAPNAGIVSTTSFYPNGIASQGQQLCFQAPSTSSIEKTLRTSTDITPSMHSMLSGSMDFSSQMHSWQSDTFDSNMEGSISWTPSMSNTTNSVMSSLSMDGSVTFGKHSLFHRHNSSHSHSECHRKSEDLGGKCSSSGKCHCPKRRKLKEKKVVKVPAVSPKLAEIPEDGYAWRKYGSKPIKGTPHPRGYYRCSSVKGCGARKHVERDQENPNMLIVTYEGEHNHPKGRIDGTNMTPPIDGNNVIPPEGSNALIVQS